MTDEECEEILVTLEPGTYFEAEGMVLACSMSGVRCAMSSENWRDLRKKYGGEWKEGDKCPS